MVTKVFPTRNFTAANYFDTTKIITTVIWNTDKKHTFHITTGGDTISHHNTSSTLSMIVFTLNRIFVFDLNRILDNRAEGRKGGNKWSDNLWLGCEIVPLENKFPPVSVLECDQVGFCAWIVPTIPADLAAVGRLPSAANRILRASIPRSGKQW